MANDYAFLSSSGAFRHAGNVCADLAWGTLVRRLKVRVLDGSSIDFESAEFTFNSNPFTQSGLTMYTGPQASDKMGFAVRTSFGQHGVNVITSNGANCEERGNGQNQGTTFCVSNGVRARSISGNVNNNVGHQVYMCAANAWCGSGSSGKILIFYR